MFPGFSSCSDSVVELISSHAHASMLRSPLVISRFFKTEIENKKYLLSICKNPVNIAYEYMPDSVF